MCDSSAFKTNNFDSKHIYIVIQLHIFAVFSFELSEECSSHVLV